MERITKDSQSVLGLEINKGKNLKNKTNEKLETEIHKWIESEIQNLLT